MRVYRYILAPHRKLPARRFYVDVIRTPGLRQGFSAPYLVRLGPSQYAAYRIKVKLKGASK